MFTTTGVGYQKERKRMRPVLESRSYNKTAYTTYSRETRRNPTYCCAHSTSYQVLHLRLMPCTLLFGGLEHASLPDFLLQQRFQITTDRITGTQYHIIPRIVLGGVVPEHRRDNGIGEP